MLCLRNATDTGRIYFAPPIKIQIHGRKSLPNINIKQYPLNAETIKDIKSIIKDDLQKRTNYPFHQSCNTAIFPVYKPHGRGWRFIQDLWAIHDIVIPWYPTVLKPHTLLAAIPPNSRTFIVIQLWSAFINISVDSEASTYLRSLGMNNNIHRRPCLQVKLIILKFWRLIPLKLNFLKAFP